MSELDDHGATALPPVARGHVPFSPRLFGDGERVRVRGGGHALTSLVLAPHPAPSSP